MFTFDSTSLLFLRIKFSAMIGTKEAHKATDKVNGIFVNTAALPVNCAYNMVAPFLSNPASNNLCGTNTELYLIHS
ncbi:hypothetical protein D3C73_1594060 [compost metagenome]